MVPPPVLLRVTVEGSQITEMSCVELLLIMQQGLAYILCPSGVNDVQGNIIFANGVVFLRVGDGNSKAVTNPVIGACAVEGSIT